MNFFRMFTKKHRYSKKQDLSTMTPEQIINISPKDVGYYIKNTSGSLTSSQESALDNLLLIKTIYKSTRLTETQKEEEIRKIIEEFVNPPQPPPKFKSYDELSDAVDKYLNDPDTTLPHISTWDVSNVDSMEDLFYGLIKNNEQNAKLVGIGNWDVSNVENMSSMFSGCANFDQPLNDWDVSNVENMSSMFSGCANFDQPLNDWDVSKVEDMTEMFYECTNFDQPLNDWDVSNVENMSSMFSGCANFDQPLNDWDVSKVEDMTEMFYECTNFDQPLNKWDINNVKYRSEMFTGCNINKKNKPTKLKSTTLNTQTILEQFFDFEPFIEFINTLVCPSKTYRLPPPIDQDTSDLFCSNKDKFTIEYFTINAPDGHSLLEVPEEKLGMGFPFYEAMLYIFSKMRRHKLPPKVKLYMLIINRFIYYYNIYLRYNKVPQEIGNFDITAGIIIYTHGVYDQLEPTNIIQLDKSKSVKNVFICSKSALGCITYDPLPIVKPDLVHPYSTPYAMINDITTTGFVNFDRSVFRYNIPCIPSTDKSHTNLSVRSVANCYDKSIDSFEAPMNHYIFPKTNSYLNKRYAATPHDTRCVVMDLEKLYQKGNAFLSSTLSESDIDSINILKDPFMRRRIKKYTDINDNINYGFNLSDIIKYCQHKGKHNVFIYDKSCSSIVNISDKKSIISKVSTLTQDYGFGKKRLHNSKRQTNKRKKTYKRTTNKRKINYKRTTNKRKKTYKRTTNKRKINYKRTTNKRKKRVTLQIQQ
jgi:surface protein